MLQLSDGLRVWDVSGGQSHSLLLADGDCVQPVLLYCGQQQEPRAAQSERPGQGQRSPSRAESYTVRPTLLPFCSEVCVKGPVWLFCLPVGLIVEDSHFDMYVRALIYFFFMYPNKI